MQSKENDKQCTPAKDRVVTVELEETNQHLEKTKEEGHAIMADYLQSLQRELEHTKRELQQLKSKKLENQQILNPEIEELKFVENEDHFELQKKRSVKFASPPSLTREIVSPNNAEDLKTSPNNTSSKKLKRKPFIPMIGGLFLKKKGNKEREMAKS
ncbi:hypothetical protein LIER_35743 [Lithospermum erythrorhizon]|uniref:WEB family protein n=1 Tax=Lithospermum erythrorhizon TaxID=34254 RepID=A0AAV3NX66_LITER